MKGMLSILAGTIVLLLMVSTCHPEGESLNFNPKDPKMKDIKRINGLLDAYITKKDRDNIEKLMSYTKDRLSKYCLLIMIEFYEDLSKDKLETVRQKSPERWKVFQIYLNRAFAWLSLTKKADDLLGGHLESVLKAELGEK